MVNSFQTLRVVAVIGRIGMGIAIILCGIWLAAGRSIFPDAFIVKIETAIFIAFLLSFAFGGKWPWLPSLVSAGDMILIFLKIVPWNEKGGSSFGHQFMADLIFFFSAQVNFIGMYLYNRSNSKPNA